jgi:hypothetical protein
MLKVAAGALAAAPLVGVGHAANTAAARAAGGAVQQPVPKFFTKDEFALVDELAEMIIPADEHSPGAREAKAAEYIDGRLAETWDRSKKADWRDGLRTIDAISVEMHGKRLMECSGEQRVAVLARISQNERSPQKPEERFFKELKGRVARAYYTSNIGIHKEMEYKGNVYLREFAGTDVSKS